jgi:MFS family permease
MAVSAPLWGMLADRYGKRIMLIRANLAGAVVMSLMGAVADAADADCAAPVAGGVHGHDDGGAGVPGGGDAARAPGAGDGRD